MKSKVLSLMLAVMVAVTMTPMFAFAAGEEEESAIEQETAVEQEPAAEQEEDADQIKLEAMADDEEYSINDLNVKLSKTVFIYSNKIDLEEQIRDVLTYDASMFWYGEGNPELDASLDSANAGSRNVTVTSPYYQDCVVLPVTIKPYTITKKALVYRLTNDQYTYNGKAKKPKFTGLEYTNDEFSSFTKIPASQYSITHTYKNNVKIGYGKVTGVIKFKGNYAGTITIKESIFIGPKPTKIKKITRGKTTLRVKWKKVKKTISGYSVLVEDAESIFGISKMKKVSKKKTSYKFKGLKRHHDYEVTVLTYKKVNGKNYYQWQLKGASKVVTTK